MENWVFVTLVAIFLILIAVAIIYLEKWERQRRKLKRRRDAIHLLTDRPWRDVQEFLRRKELIIHRYGGDAGPDVVDIPRGWPIEIGKLIESFLKNSQGSYDHEKSDMFPKEWEQLFRAQAEVILESEHRQWKPLLEQMTRHNDIKDRLGVTILDIIRTKKCADQRLQEERVLSEA